MSMRVWPGCGAEDAEAEGVMAGAVDGAGAGAGADEGRVVGAAEGGSVAVAAGLGAALDVGGGSAVPHAAAAKTRMAQPAIVQAFMFGFS